MIRTAAMIASASRAISKQHLDGLGTRIPIPVARCADYASLLRGEHGEPTDADALLDWASRHGRIMLSGRGASGKTTLLHRLAVLSADLGSVPILVDLSRWDNAASLEWRKVSGSVRDAIDMLVRRFNTLALDLTDIEFLPAATGKVFLVDGLNETPGSTPDTILDVLDQVAALVPGCCVVVSDRLTRRELGGSGKWRLAMPLPVVRADVLRLIAGCDVPDDMADLLGIPFFLDRAVRGELRASKLATIEALVGRHVTTPEGLASVAGAAFDAYEAERTRSFAMARFRTMAGERETTALVAGAVLIDAGDGDAAFSHHLIHDYLASRHVANHPGLLDPGSRHHVLDVLTFGANSFDAIAFVLGLVPAAEATRILRAVYD